jgi:NAD(P)-dependent dehydrogenase (short-subunit alcohol dehydrogenase family)
MYSASKAAVSAIAHTLQLELSPFDVKGITVMGRLIALAEADDECLNARDKAAS